MDTKTGEVEGTGQAPAEQPNAPAAEQQSTAAEPLPQPPVAPESTDPQAQTETAHLDKQGVEHPQAGKPSGVVGSEAQKQVTPGTVVVISKGADKIPVQVKDGAHLERLIAEHGLANVKVSQ